MSAVHDRGTYAVIYPGAEALTEDDRREYWAVYGDAHFLSGYHTYGQQPYTMRAVRQETALYTLHTVRQEGYREVRRTPRHVRQSSHGMYQLYLHLDGSPLMCRQGDAEAVLAPGVAALVGEEGAYEARGGSHSSLTLRVPERQISDRVGGAPPQLEVEFRTGLGRLIGDMVQGLYKERDVITQAQFDAVCGHVVDLLCMLLVGDRCPTPDLRAYIETQARQYIRAHASEQDLSLPRVATALGWSPRRLQEIMSGSGTGYRELVREERLARARYLLGGGPDRLPSVYEVAAQCGFTSISTFGRLFRMRYGESPRSYRLRMRRR